MVYEVYRAGPARVTELGALWASEGIKVPKGEGCKQVVSGWQRKRSGGSFREVMLFSREG